MSDHENAMSVRIRLKNLIFIRNVKRWEFAFYQGERFENWDALIKSGDINICCMQYARIKNILYTKEGGVSTFILALHSF